MSTFTYAKDLLIVLSILVLLAVGTLITLKSGMVTVGGDRPRVVLGNVSNLIVTLVGCMFVLMVLQEIVGFRLGW